MIRTSYPFFSRKLTHRQKAQGSSGETSRLRLSPRLTALITSAIFSLYGSLSLGLEDDSEQPINISSDRAEFNRAEGLSIYLGNVVMIQGSLQITADKLIISSKNNEIEKIRAFGQPAHLQQRPALDEGPTHARAQQILYLKQDQLIYLEDNAEVDQPGKAKVISQEIQYNLVTEIITAQSSGATAVGEAKAGSAPEDSRVKIVIQPQQKND